jgi:hypothetical protein
VLRCCAAEHITATCVYLLSVQFSCTKYTLCTLNTLYSNTLNLTLTLSLCNYCQYSSIAHCTLSVHSLCCTVTHSTICTHSVTVRGSSGKKVTKMCLLVALYILSVRLHVTVGEMLNILLWIWIFLIFRVIPWLVTS